MFNEYFFDDESNDYLLEYTKTIKKRIASDMVDSIKNTLDIDLSTCNNIDNDIDKLSCKQQAYIKAINTMKVLQLTCKTQRCLNTINNHIYKLQQKYAEITTGQNNIQVVK